VQKGGRGKKQQEREGNKDDKKSGDKGPLLNDREEWSQRVVRDGSSNA